MKTMSRPPLIRSILERVNAGRSSNLPMTQRVVLFTYVEGPRSADMLDTRHWWNKVMWEPTKPSRLPSTLMAGVLDSYLSWQYEDRRITAQRTLKAEAMSQLTGSKDYQEWVRMAEAELDGGEERGEEGLLLYKSVDDGNLEDWEEEDEVNEC